MTRYTNFGHAVLTAQRDRTPDAVAVTFAGRDHLTFEELNRRVNRRAKALAAAEVSPGDRVATLLDSPLSVLEVYLAQAKLGTVLAALNPFWSPDVFVPVLTRSQVTAFVYDARFDDLVAQLRPELPGVRQWLRLGGAADDALDFDALTDTADDAEPDIRAGSDAPLALFFTSGTTGLPKAVVHTHLSGLAIAEKLWLDVPLGRDAVVGTGPIVWGIGFLAVAAPALAGGARLVLEEGFGPSHFLGAVPRERITHLSVTPSFFVELLSDRAHETVDLSSLRVAMLGGEPLLSSLQQRIHQRLPELALYGYYGQTEAPYSVIGRRDQVPDDVVGWARTGGAVRVVDGTGQRITGEIGEIQLAGPHVAAGYDGQPEAAEQALRDGWFTGGDLGKVDRAGRVSVLGRRADAIVRGGVFTLPAQVEDVASTVDGVAEAAAVGVDGGAEPKILLVVRPEQDRTVDPEVVRAAVADKLPPESRPDLVAVADELPHANDGSGGQGKLLRREVRERWGHLLEAARP
ncbi:class I adenylate-forming enzyme family protein [Amycolatopsis silviterrae]|uniref:Class I adenylate-forming enzyme family protein n=1 Tax=Amycolatopsis silviterrae TaxID=1656914 RepID=A0ABW5H6V3_9PSEU